ncbi:MAG: YdiU family protein [Oceanospirillaceae bacterium]|nr:YdiU family protein [Oceanospirillaceae bacterium]
MTDKVIDSGLNIDSSYARELEGLYVSFQGDLAPKPELIKLNHALADELGLAVEQLEETKLAALLSGGNVPVGGAPLAQAYAGHQFGGFSPQLGDGRALLLAEVIDKKSARRDIHLKGSGRTIFSRGGDGKAVLGPILREYLLAEAMHRLGVPTTRGLAVVTTGETIMRSQPLPGAVLARVAKSHIRVGSFQFVAARGDTKKLAILADYTIARHFPSIQQADDRYLKLLIQVCERQAFLMAKWMSVGFVHGVMNTDNITISGETIDYGPCAFLDVFDPSAVFSSIDTHMRYAYAKQPSMALWGLTRFAETLLPLIDRDEKCAIELVAPVLNDFEQAYQRQWLICMRAKLGLQTAQSDDVTLINDLLTLMVNDEVDFTHLFRALSGLLVGSETALNLFANKAAFKQWQVLWMERLADEPITIDERAVLMRNVNPMYIPRNHLVEEVISAAEQQGDFKPFEKLLEVLDKPFTKREGLNRFAQAAPESFGAYETFCGT